MIKLLPRRAVLAAALALLFLDGFGQHQVRAEAAESRLTIVSSTGQHSFTVEVASSIEERAKGLMYRRSLAADRGMIFDFGSDTEVNMWMRNTYIPLDMLFVRSDGVIHRVQRDTVPFSEENISAGAPVRYVIELAGGTAKRLGIDRGDKVQHAIIRR